MSVCRLLLLVHCIVVFTLKPNITFACGGFICDVFTNPKKAVEDAGTAVGDVVRGTARVVTAPLDPVIKDCGGDICGALKDGRKMLTGEDKVDRAKKEQRKVQAELTRLKDEWVQKKGQLESSKKKLSEVKLEARAINGLVRDNIYYINSRIKSQIESLLIVREKIEVKKKKYLKLRDLYKNQEFERNSYEAYQLTSKVISIIKIILDESIYDNNEPLAYEYNLSMNKYDFLNKENKQMFTWVKSSLDHDRERIKISISSLDSQIADIDSQVNALEDLKSKNILILNNKLEVN